MSQYPENRYRYRKIDSVAVKGQHQKTTIYELLDAYEDEIIVRRQRNLPLWNRAIELFENNNQEQAHLLFQGIIEEDPDDYPAQIYLERCKDRRKKERREKPRGIEIEV